MIIRNTGKFNLPCSVWLAQPFPYQTWVRFRRDFKAANDTVNADMTTGGAGFQANLAETTQEDLVQLNDNQSVLQDLQANMASANIQQITQ